MKPLAAVALTCLLAAAFATALAPAVARADVTAVEPQPQLTLPRITVRAGFHQLDVQVASQPRERQVGLMFRRDMPEHEGMLFVFEVPGVQCFWMQNTLIPLTAAFLSDDGHIVNLADMDPQTTNSHCSAEPVRYVLETNRGWFATRHIAAGQKLLAPLFDAP